MAFIEYQFRSTNKDEEDCLYAIQLATASVMPVVMQQAMELELFQTIAKAGEGAQLSASEIASQLSTTNPEAPMMIHRILRLLTSYSVLTSSVTTGDNGHVDRVYGLAPVCKYLIPDKDGVGLSSTLCFLTNDFGMRTMFGLKGTILEGGMTFSKVHGVSFYEYMEKDPKYAELFNKFIFDETTISMRKILEEYKGFEDLKVVVDVAGGMGAMSSIITRKYPSINCINFDLPRVIQLAPSDPRVKHVGGDMFVNVPKADAAILKRILHNWSDDDCVAILKKCYEAVPDQGNVIVLDAIVPEVLESNTAAKGVCQLDILMMAYCPGGRQRTLKEFEYLAKEAGFGGVRLACLVPNYGVLEFYKTI